MKQITVAICIDALRYDFVNNSDSPFLHNLSQEGITSKIEGSLSYEMAPMWFAGLYPESSDKWFLYWKSPSTSPYRRIPIPNFTSLTRHQKIRFAAQIMLNRIFKSGYGCAPYIPLNMVKSFDFSERFAPWHTNYLPKATLFSIMREFGLQWLYIGTPGSNQRTNPIVENFRKSLRSQDFIWLHFGETDSTEHQFGPMSSERRSALRAIDLGIKEIYDILKKKYDVTNTIIFGDHGCIDVLNKVNILDYIKDIDACFDKSFTFFLDSTAARFWFDNKNVGKKIVQRLQDVKHGRFLTKDDLLENRCNFQHNKYGDLIWIADPGTIILPNYWDGR